MRRISVFVCERQPIVIEGLAKVLAGCEDLEFGGAASNLNEALEQLRQPQSDVVLLDSNFGTSQILRFVGGLQNASISTYPVLWVSELPEVEELRALQLGVRGILKKDLPVSRLTECLREVASGKIWMEKSDQMLAFLERRQTSRLTPREKEVVRLVCRGMKNRQIAENLHITPGTVKVHLMHVFEKTGLKDRLALAVYGRELPGLRADEPESEPALKTAGSGVD